MSAIKTDKESVCKFLKKLNNELMVVISDMKSDFEKNPPAANGIKQRLLGWKGRYSEIISNNLKETIISYEADQNNFDFKDFLSRITEDHGSDQDFLDNLRYLNTSIEGLKDFIRMHLIKDPSVYYIKEI